MAALTVKNLHGEPIFLDAARGAESLGHPPSGIGSRESGVVGRSTGPDWRPSILSVGVPCSLFLVPPCFSLFLVPFSLFLHLARSGGHVDLIMICSRNEREWCQPNGPN